MSNTFNERTKEGVDNILNKMEMEGAAMLLGGYYKELKKAFQECSERIEKIAQTCPALFRIGDLTCVMYLKGVNGEELKMAIGTQRDVATGLNDILNGME